MKEVDLMVDEMNTSPESNASDPAVSPPPPRRRAASRPAGPPADTGEKPAECKHQ